MSEFSSAPRTAPRPNPAPRPGRRSALALWTISGAGLVLINLLSLPLSRAMAGLDAQVQTLIYNLLYYLGFAALPMLLLARRRPGLWRACRPESVSFLSTLSIVALALLGVFFFTDLSILWSILLEAVGLYPGAAGIAIPASSRGLILSIFYVAVLPAVCEEFVFRGAVLSAFERDGTRRAVWISALLFALLHGSIGGFPQQLLIGAILGWLVVWCDSIYAGLIYHTTHNAATLILQYALSRGASADAQVQSAPQTMLDALGGMPGLMQLLVELALIGAMMFLALRMFRLTARLRGVRIRPARPARRMRASEWALLSVGALLVAMLFAADLYIALQLGGGA